MNWINLIWHVMAGTCLALAGVHLLVWVRRREALEHLGLAVAALAVASLGVLEPLALQAKTADEYALILRWYHVPVAVFFLAIVPFVRLRFGVGSVSLGVAAIALRLVSLAANFSTGVNVNFLHIDAVVPISFLGMAMVVPKGTPNPWMTTGSLSLLLLAFFLLHALWEIWRRKRPPDRWHASATLFSAAAFILSAGAWALLVVTGSVDTPYMVVPLFAGVVLALGFDLGAQLMLVPELSRSLEQSEAGRHEGEMQLQLAGRLAGLGTWTWGCREGGVFCSDSALALLDLPLREPLDRTRLAASISPEHRASILQGYEAAQTGSGEFQNEFCVKLRNGGERWLSAIGHLERDVAGQPLAVQGVLIDITHRREADQRFRRLVEIAPTGILVVRNDGVIVFANQRAGWKFGYPDGELCGMSVDELVPTPRRPEHAALRHDYFADPADRAMASTREVFGRRKDGSEFPVEVTLSVMATESGPQVLAIVSDISARKQAEQEAGERRNELAHLARVSLLAELSGSLAHELNQPLTAILSNAQAGARFLARDPPDLEEVKESLRNIVDSDKRAGEIIRRLRAMLRKEPPDFQRLDLNEVVSDVLHIVHSDLVTRNVEVRLELEPDLPATMGDRVQLQQVVLNLIMNGCDAMALCPGQPVLTVQTGQCGAGRIMLDVTDEGCGIPEADLERVFAPFVSSKSAGLGLGLAVCRTIVHAHDGRLWAENNAGPGATLHLELRAAQATAAA